MADYFAIPDSALDPDAPVTSELAYAFRDNVVAMAQGAIGAPYMESGWVPFDGSVYGDSNGVIYDYNIDGALAAVVTPDYELGYDYCISFAGVNGASGGSLFMASMRVGGSTFVDSVGIGFGSAGYRATGFVIFPNANTAPNYSRIFYGFSNTSATEAGAVGSHVIGSYAYVRSRISWASGNITGGRIMLYKRLSNLGITS